MIRKLLLVAAATAMPLGFIAATTGTSSAGTPKVNATTATVSCTGISGTASFKPNVTTDESAGTGKTSIKATLTGCTTNDGVTVTKASVKGTLTTTRTAGENGCTALAGGSAAAGPLTTKWSTTPKLSSGASVINVTSIAGSIGGDGNATFSIPGNTPNGAPSGSFQGLNAGASDTTTAQTTTSALSILTTCETGKGLKSISIESPASGAAVSLG
jgi:hypothetical protein